MQKEAERKSTEFFNSKIHPEDFKGLIQKATRFLEFLYPLSKEERSQYKLVNEFRVLNEKEKYVIKLNLPALAAIAIK